MLALCVSFGIVILDQVTKFLVSRGFHPGDSVPVIPGFFDLAYVRNTGAAWGLFGGWNGWLAVLSVVVLFCIVRFRRSLVSDSAVHRLAFGLMTGGIVGNLLDRVRLQHVVDFIDLHWGPHHFPAFNVADSAICVGVALYVLSSLWQGAHPLRARGDEGAAGGPV